MTRLGGVLVLLAHATAPTGGVDHGAAALHELDPVMARVEPILSLLDQGVKLMDQTAKSGAKGVSVRERLVMINQQMNEDITYFQEVLTTSKMDVLEKLQEAVTMLRKHINDFASKLEVKYTMAEQANATFHKEKETLTKLMSDMKLDVATLRRNMGKLQFNTNELFNKTFTASFTAMRVEMQDLLNELKNFKRYAMKRHEGLQEVLQEDIDRIMGEILAERSLANAEVADETKRESERFTRNQKRMTELISDAHATLESMHKTYDDTQESMEKALDDVAELSGDRALRLNTAADQLQTQRDDTFTYLEARVDGTGSDAGGKGGVVTEVDNAYAADEAAMAESMTTAEEGLEANANVLNGKITDGYNSLNTNANTIETSDTATNQLLAEFDQKYDTMRADFKNKKSLTNVQINALKQRIETDSNTLKQGTATAAAEIQGALTGDLNAAAFKAKAALATSMNTAQTELDTELDAVKADATKLKGTFEEDLSDLTSDQPTDPGVLVQYQNEQDKIDTKIQQTEQDVADQEVKLKQAEQSMMAKIDEKDANIEEYINKQGSRMQKKFAPFEQAAAIIDRDATENIKKLPAELENADSDMKQAKETFAANEEKLNGEITAAKEHIGVKMHARATEMDEVLGQVAVTMNQVLPALQKYAVSQGQKTLNHLEGIQAQLRAATKGAVATAAAAEVKDGGAMQMDASAVAATLARELRDAATRQQDTVKAVTTQIKETGAKLEGQNAQALKGAHETAQLAEDVKRAIEVDSTDLAGAANELAAKAQATGATSAIAQANAAVSGALTAKSQQVKAEIKRAEDKANQDVAQIQRVLEADTKSKAAAVVSNAEKEYDGAQRNARNEEQEYRDKIAKSKEEVRVMLAHMKGESANETEWAAKLKEEIAGASADTHSLAILGAKSKLEMQAAIDTRFRDMKKIVAEDVHGLEATKQAMVNRLMDEAKKEYQRIASSEAHTEEEKEERLAKINAWLAGQLQDITDNQNSAKKEFTSAAEATLAFEREAEARLNEFRGRMDAEDAAIGVDHERAEVEQTHTTLADLIQDAAAEVDRLKSQSESRGSQIASQHELESNRLNAAVMNDIKALEQEMAEAERWCNEAVDQLETSAQQPAEQARQTNQEMKSYMQQVDETQQALGQRLAEQQQSRERRLSFLEEWQEGIQKLAAESMERMVTIMNQLLGNSKHKFEQDKEKTDKFADRLEDAMNSEAVQVLTQIHAADTSVDQILQKDKDLQKWAKVYEEGTYKWRQDVAEKLNKLGGGLSEELGLIANSAAEFQFNLNHYAEGAEGAAHNAIKKVLMENAKAMEAAEKAEEGQLDHLADMFAKNANQTYQEAADLGANVAADAAATGDRQKDLEQAGDLLKDGLKNSEQDAKETAKAAKQMLDTNFQKMEQMHNAAENKLKTITDNLDAATSSGFIETGAGARETLRENIQLNAEHKRLQERLSELEQEAATLQL